jgi:hypothetical protein
MPFVFSKLNPVRKVALRAPPVPNKSVTNPDMILPYYLEILA